MEEKKYLKWYNKIGYGSGDIAGSGVYNFLAAFVMIYLTNTIGLNPGIIGTLMMLSKLCDGISDVFFGAMIDKTRSKLGRARPWMLFGFIGCAITMVLIYAIPTSWGQTAQYIYFFITYTLLNAVFYTANNVAYGTLTALITKNGNERVQMGSIRFMFSYGTSIVVQAVTVGAVEFFGGGAVGWRTVAIVYAIIGLISNTISAFSVKELSDEELDGEDNVIDEDGKVKYSLKDAAKMLLHNKYYLMICCVYILQQIYSAMINSGIYFMTYVLGDANLLGTFSVAINLPMILGLLITPFLVKKMNGMYKLNLSGYLLGTVSRGLVIVGAYMGSVPMMLVFSAIASIGMSPLQGDLTALIASASEYTYLTQNKRLDGTMFSCSSFGTKLGGGIGTAMSGWLLAAGGYVADAAVQSASCINMLHCMYLWIPMIINFVIMLILSRLKVEKANEELIAAKNA
ncbi:MFS transporter [Butyricicoccus porcorum]|uniref:MFS transporter n=1 Tax=Butyricicoccus porcorum TaxID=1945634 RepID=A0A252F3D8_9FIRM|nr:MFS transporter [Butyricicoccus porcorum]OUM20313.1 MFS transporter [Butyricicoccus porcorum]